MAGSSGTVPNQPRLPVTSGQTLFLLAPEFRLLCDAIRYALGTYQADLPGNLHWPTVLDGARRHRLTPLVLDYLENSSALNVPDGVLATLRRDNKAQALRCLSQMATIQRLSQAFAADNIRMIPLKGIVLSHQLHGTLIARPAGDIDLLVDPLNLWQADAVLIKLGYQRQSAAPTPRLKQAYAKWAKDLIYDGKGTHIELHQRLSENPYLLPFDMDTIWEQRETVEISGQIYPVLNRRFLALYLAVHGAGHCWERLRWLLDLAQILMAPGAQSCAMDDAEAAGIGPLMQQAIHLAHDWLNLPLTDDRLAPTSTTHQHLVKYVNRFSPGSGGGISARNHLEWRWRMQLYHRLNRYTLKSDWRYWAHQLAGEAVTPFDWAAFPLPDRVFGLYLLLRPFGWLIRHWHQFFQSKGKT